ncbi:universal stress protein [Membranihabitans marinus]|uniref:universal stress protein n=1 Tax=Membranihabitans marinus TaxID=1227546 RepID=UPI001F26C212|nr:hypothetical protein [Membranihabitans marinus]
MKNLLLPISFSETSKNALYYGHMIVNEYGSNLTLLHCYSEFKYNREYNFTPFSYDEGIRKKLVEFYNKNIKSNDHRAIRVLTRQGSISDYISEISHRYDLVVLSRKTSPLTKSKRRLADKVYFLTSISNCPVLLMPSKRIDFSFSKIKKIWHIQRMGIENEVVQRETVKFRIEPNLITTKSLQQKNFTSVLWRNIVQYTKTHDETELKIVQESYADENIDLIILVNHRKTVFQKFLKDDTFQIINQFDIPILVLPFKE